jgi:predicted nucleotidyltransferase
VNAPYAQERISKMRHHNQVAASDFLPESKIKAFCQKWQITEFALFGSSVRGNFRPDSDIDVLVTFDPVARWTLFDHVDMQTELKAILDRDVDLVNRRGIERSRNYIRRQAILDSAQVIYAVS